MSALASSMRAALKATIPGLVARRRDLEDTRAWLVPKAAAAINAAGDLWTALSDAGAVSGADPVSQEELTDAGDWARKHDLPLPVIEASQRWQDAFGELAFSEFDAQFSPNQRGQA